MTKTTNEAFVYCWTNLETGRKYIGYHRGTYDDGYVSSSKYFNHEYKEAPSKFSRQIVANGTVADIRTLENKILESVNAACSDEYYNKHNGGSRFYPDEAARKKAGISNTGKKRSKEVCEKISTAMKGKKRKPFTEETKMKMSQSQILRGGNGPKQHTDETKLKMSVARKGKKQSSEHIEKRIAAGMKTVQMRGRLKNVN